MNKFPGNWNGKTNSSIDGTGVLESVNEEIAERILRYIQVEFPGTKTILDVGAGQGLFQKRVEELSDCLVYSIEGCSDVPFRANQDRLIISDATIPFTEEYYKKFDLVTSFECIEHVPLQLQDSFWKNVFYSSNKALVGIHCLNEEDERHCLIRGLDWWVNFFDEKKINHELLGSPNNHWSVWPESYCSLFFKLAQIS